MFYLTILYSNAQMDTNILHLLGPETTSYYFQRNNNNDIMLTQAINTCIGFYNLDTLRTNRQKHYAWFHLR